MKAYKPFLGILIIFILTSCSSHKRIEDSAIKENAVTEEAETVESPTREAVFVYGNPKDCPKRLVLTLAGEPVLLPSGYVRLVGVVSGGRPIACLEIGGRGLALGKGENINDYRVVGINDDSVVLERGK